MASQLYPPPSASIQASLRDIVPEPPWKLGQARWDFREPLIMGVLNATPDSFSDGGAYLSPERAVSHAKTLWAEGAHLIDLGGASSHPLAAPVAAEDELARIAPVLERLLDEVPLPVSVDTVAEHFQRAGYYTIGITANPNTNGTFHFDQGYTFYQGTNQRWHQKRSPAQPANDPI